MLPLAVGPLLNEYENVPVGLGVRRPVVVGDEFVLQGREETVGPFVIPPIPRATHARHCARRVQGRAIGTGSVLGEFNRSSQHLISEVDDDKDRQTRIEPFDTRQMVITRSAACIGRGGAGVCPAPS